MLNLVTVHTNKRTHVKNTHACKNRDNATGRVLEDRLSVYQTDSESQVDYKNKGENITFQERSAIFIVLT